MAHSRGFRNRSQSRRRTEWFQGVGGVTVVTSSTSQAQLLGAGVITTFGEETLGRTRGLFEAQVVGAPASDGDGYFGAVGIGVVSSPAYTAGIGSVPTPVTEMGWDGWLWHHFFSVHTSVAAEAAGPGRHHRVEIDSKAMRKVQTDQTIFAAVESFEQGTAVVHFFLDTRILSILP